MAHLIVSRKAFSAIRRVDEEAEALQALPDREVRALLPCLVRMALCLPLDSSDHWVEIKKKILQKLSATEMANSMVSLLSVDFHALETDVKKEMQLRGKLGSHPGDSVLISSLSDGLALEFERSDGIRRLRLVLSELFAVQSFVRNVANGSHSGQPTPGLRASELFDNEVYLEDVSDVLCIALAELPSSLLLVDVVETLLHVTNGGVFIGRLVANAPETFHEVCLSLLNNGEKQDEETFVGRTRLNALRLLCQMNPEEALVIRAEAIDFCRMPGLTVMVTLDHFQASVDQDKKRDINDIVSFISGNLLGSDDKVRTWFAQYIRMGQKRIEQGQETSLAALREELLTNLSNLVDNELVDSGSGSDYNIVQGSALLRLYCALRGAAGMKFSEEESHLILNLITCHPPPTPAGIKLVSLGLCMLLSCSTLIATPEAERKAVDWIQWLVKEESFFGQVSGVRSSFGEMLLLIAIHFHSNQINAISELVCTTLGMKLPIRANNLTRMKAIFTQEIFPDHMVTAHAVKVPVSPNLNSGVVGFLPVHCIYQLLKSRAFTKHKVPIKEWIFKQICSSITPLHPVLPPLIEAYVNSVIVPSSKTTLSATNEPMEEDELMLIFRHKIYSVEDNSEVDISADGFQKPTCVVTSQLLLLYYILLYEDIRLTQTKAIIASERKVKKYSAEFISQVPVFYLIQEARTEQHKYGVLFPHLLRLISTHYPHLCLVQDWLATERRAQLKPILRPFSVCCTKKRLVQCFDKFEKEPSSLLNILDKLMLLPKDRLWPLAPLFVAKLPLLLSATTPRQVLEKAKKVWWALNSIFPDNLWVMTVNAFRLPSHPLSRGQQLAWNDIVFDPLHVLRCDERVYRCPEIMEITLHMLSAFLAASKIGFGHHLLEKPTKSVEEEKDREELRIALVSAQESAAIQILLESCLPKKGFEEEGLLTPLREVQGLVCTHLHQVFISDTNLAKLVHFQAYSSRLLPLIVSAVPSMHICLDFLPELLSQPDLNKQIFAIELCSYLSEQYSIPKSISAAKLCFNVANTLLSILSSEKRSRFFTPVLPALVRMCKTFPPLYEDAVILLIQLGQVCISKLAATSSTFISAQAVLQKYSKPLAQRDWNEADKLFASLPNDEAFCLIIQRSFRSLCETPVLRNIS